MRGIKIQNFPKKCSSEPDINFLSPFLLIRKVNFPDTEHDFLRPRSVLRSFLNLRVNNAEAEGA